MVDDVFFNGSGDYIRQVENCIAYDNEQSCKMILAFGSAVETCEYVLDEQGMDAFGGCVDDVYENYMDHGVPQKL